LELKIDTSAPFVAGNFQDHAIAKICNFKNEIGEKALAHGHEQEGHETSGFFHGRKLRIIRRVPPSLVVQSVRPVA
jgi:hypothetical protein